MGVVMAWTGSRLRREKAFEWPKLCYALGNASSDAGRVLVVKENVWQIVG